MSERTAACRGRGGAIIKQVNKVNMPPFTCNKNKIILYTSKQPQEISRMTQANNYTWLYYTVSKMCCAEV